MGFKKEYKVISVTPAGRKHFLEVLVPYLLKNRDLISEHHFWLNTTNKEDIEYMESLVKEYPDFFKINKKEMFNPTRWICIWQYFQDYIDKDTIYIRLDDDICFIADDAIKKLIECRINDPRPYLIFGNIINNAFCSYFHQNNGAIPKKGYLIKPGNDVNIIDSGKFAEKVHLRFIKDYKKGNIDRWKLDNIIDVKPSVNVICWFGKDLRKVKEIKIKDLTNVYINIKGKKFLALYEEWMLNSILPKKYNRPNMICGDAIFVHFSYTNQNSYLIEQTSLLKGFKDIESNTIIGIKIRNQISKLKYWLLINLFLKFDLSKYQSYVHVYSKKFFPRTYKNLGKIKNKIK